MLKPLSNTNYRLKSCIINHCNTFDSTSAKEARKRVAFSEEGISHEERVDKAMAKAKQQSKRKTKRRERTTPQPKEPDIAVIGSSYTWKDSELERFMVKVVGNIDVRKMIPEKFFNFDHLKNYKDCTYIL
jgi:hypothetical protein